MRNRREKIFQKGVPLSSFGTILTKDQLTKIRVIPVAWGVPFDEICYSKFMVHFEAYANKMPWDDWIPSEGTYLTQARNYIHNTFKNKCDLDFLQMLDSDILFPPGLVERLMAHKKPIVGGWYRDKKADDHHPVIYNFDYEDKEGTAVWKHRNKPGEGLERVDGMGAGCWLMSREVVEALGEDPYGKNIAGGEDMILCRKLMKLDIPLYVDWSINCAHFGVGFY